MERKKAYQIFLYLFLFSAAIGVVVFILYTAKRNIPEHIYLLKGEEYDIDTMLPISVEIEDDYLEASAQINYSRPLTTVGLSEAADKSVKSNISISGRNIGSCRLKVRLLGFIDWADVNVDVVEQNMVYPGGEPIGIYLDTDGVMVIGTAKLSLMGGGSAEPAYGLISSGDYILKADENDISSKEELTDYIAASEGKNIILTVRRKSEIIEVKIKPVKCDDGCYRAGIWVRDDTQGIGTLTFVEGDGSFAALGHGISDTDTALLVEAENGALYDAYVHEIMKGACGKPGSLIGSINYSEKTFEGYITENSDCGIFGKLDNAKMFIENREPISIGYRQDVVVGNASIMCCVDGDVKEYDIRINKIDLNASDNKNMVIEVVDEELLNVTGGIVQGMSGSPIIQNGRLVGAVTHVMVNDPSKGYGIFIEEMIK